MSVTVLAGIVREVRDKSVRVSAVGGSQDFSLIFDYGFPLKCTVGDEFTMTVQSVTPPAPPTQVKRRKLDPNLEKGRPSVPGPA